MMKLLLGGTSDSTAILEVLDRLKINVTSSVVTDYGRHLASKFGQPVIQGRLTAEDMVSFIKENDVDEIIDATHPFADIVSKEAIRAAEMAGVSYLRFERQATLDLSGAIVVHSTQEAIDEILKFMEDHRRDIVIWEQAARPCRSLSMVCQSSGLLFAFCRLRKCFWLVSSWDW